MNGDQQQERSKALSDIRKRLDVMDSDFLAIVVQEVNDRKKEGISIREEIQVEMRDERRQRRDQTLLQREYVDEKNNEIVGVVLAFMLLPWWKRYVWCLFGGRTLQYVERWVGQF